MKLTDFNRNIIILIVHHLKNRLQEQGPKMLGKIKVEDVLVRILVNILKYKRTDSNSIPLKFTLTISVHSVSIKTLLH